MFQISIIYQRVDKQWSAARFLNVASSKSSEGANEIWTRTRANNGLVEWRPNSGKSKYLPRRVNCFDR